MRDISIPQSYLPMQIQGSDRMMQEKQGLTYFRAKLGFRWMNESLDK